ncbi:hypothetical protein QFZ82_007799 [Streptomyces sp. V4I23]|uniref:hypothetical protein n=1 Tax=Streptomyces sp. V4I23 TaxID=3042282 RepID=UPI00278A2A7C|nr:hypothetical protein [Streptomyces sp. V4I23]MDQ1013314.1 hypothetical protein [Streptomyces sp. V4I23]
MPSRTLTIHCPLEFGPLAVPIARRPCLGWAAYATQATGRADTMLLAAPDMQGMQKGERHHAGHFMDRIIADGTEMCAYVFASDVDVHTLDGYRLAS